MAKYRKIDLEEYGVHPELSRLIRVHHFYTLWKNDADRSDFFEFVNKVRLGIGSPPYSREKFEEGWQYRTVLHADYSVAREEVFNLIFGWW